MKRLYLVFNIVRLTATLKDLIPNQYILSLLNSIIVNRKKEQKVKRVLNSHQYYRQYQYLIQQKSFRLKFNSQKSMSSIFILEKVIEFHYLNSCTPQFIQIADFKQIKFQSISIALSCSNLERRVDVRKPVFIIQHVITQDLVISQKKYFIQDLHKKTQ